MVWNEYGIYFILVVLLGEYYFVVVGCDYGIEVWFDVEFFYIVDFFVFFLGVIVIIIVDGD